VRASFWSVWVLSGVVLLGLGTTAYLNYAALLPPTPEAVAGLTVYAEYYLLAVGISLALVLVGLGLAYRERIATVRREGLAPIAPGWIIPYVLSMRKYRWYFLASSIGYGLFYAVITSMIVYQPSVDFVSAYGAAIPSASVTPIHGAPLFTPVLTVYLTDHLGMLVIPLTLVLVVTISVLVGLNFALAGFAFGSRGKGGGRGWVGGIGAAVGLFTGCPTCAGLFFANVVGGAGAVSFATILGYYQPAFILVSIPVLLGAPYVVTRSLSKVYRDGCVVLKR
jgi:hypothetical protein